MKWALNRSLSAKHGLGPRRLALACDITLLELAPGGSTPVGMPRSGHDDPRYPSCSFCPYPLLCRNSMIWLFWNDIVTGLTRYFYEELYRGFSPASIPRYILKGTLRQATLNIISITAHHRVIFPNMPFEYHSHTLIPSSVHHCTSLQPRLTELLRLASNLDLHQLSSEDNNNHADPIPSTVRQPTTARNRTQSANLLQFHDTSNTLRAGPPGEAGR